MRQRRAIPCEEVRELDHARGRRDGRQQTSIGLREALETLPEDQRQVLVLRHLVGLTPGEIAGRLGKSEPSVHGLHHRGRGALRTALSRARVRARPCARRWRRDGPRPPPSRRPIPVTQARPGRPRRCSRSCSRSSAASLAPARSRWAPSSRPSRPSSPRTARPTTPSACPRAPRRSSLALRALGIGARRRGHRPVELVHRDGRGGQPGRRDAEARRRRPRDAPDHAPRRSRPAIGPRTRCVIPVHLMGSTVDMTPIIEVARAAGLSRDRGLRAGARRPLPAAAASARSATSAASRSTRRRTSAPGATAARSSPPNPALADRVRLLRSHGEGPRYHHRMVGTTARLDALQAALLRVKLRRPRRRNEDRRRRRRGAARRGSWATSVELPDAGVGRRRPRVPPVHRAHAAARGAARASSASAASRRAVHYPIPIHRTGAYASWASARAACRWPSGSPSEICTLPLFPTMSDDEVAQRRRRGRRTSTRRSHDRPQAGDRPPFAPVRRAAPAAHGRRRLRLLGPQPRPQRRSSAPSWSSPRSASATPRARRRSRRKRAGRAGRRATSTRCSPTRRSTP